MNDQQLLAAFRRNPDGTWTTTEHITVEGPGAKISMSPGQTFSHGAVFAGINLATLLDGAAARAAGR